MSDHAHTAARRRVVSAARKLLGERGANVTLSEIAAAVGLRLGESCLDDAPLVESLLGLRVSEMVELANDPPAPIPRSPSAEDVRAILLDGLHSPPTTLQSVARTLAVSPRTLQRRLADEGTSWRSEIDAVRRDRAVELIRQGVSAQLTAVRVGYSSSRALRRALQRWQRGQVGVSGPQVDVHGPPAGGPPSASSDRVSRSSLDQCSAEKEKQR